ncbi:MAG: RecQ family ATP-dependent DNA helicase [Puniceicoccaceae bacterium]|nr:MAG: RecQ family ATP-dependent DNA helicase [Puniceicoccaceae bacterium]
MEGKPDPGSILANVFGFDAFRPGQEDVIGHLLAGRSALAVFPTGGGKSLCYQLPALVLEGMTLVVSPLIALMKDQIDYLLSRGVRAARLDSSQSGEEARQVWSDLREGRLKLLYVAPERFASERFLQRLRRTAIGLMVIDEAHCISEWGHNFRPDYMKLARLAAELRVGRVLALTATATPPVAEDIRKSFGIEREAYVNTGFHRPNLTLRVTPVEPRERERRLVERLRAGPPGAAIVYVTLQKTAEQMAARLSECGIAARAYHAGLPAEERHAIQDAFMKGKDGVVVATIAFGMGIDKADIRAVCHYNPPKSLENYMQEIGRAGRDGKPSDCELFFCSEDLNTLENFSFGDTPDPEAVRGLVEELLALPETFDVSLHELSMRWDIRTLVVSTLLTYLELDGVLASTGPRYNEYSFQPRRGSAEILAGFDAERAAFLKRLFSRAKKGRTWFSIDLAETAAALGEPRERLVAALNFLEERGELVLKVSGLRHGYRFLKKPAESGAVAAALQERFEQAERRDLGRIRQVETLAAARDCVTRQVLAYFGEDLGGPCGHCDRCLGEAVPAMPDRPADALGAEERELLRTLCGEEHEALATPRQLARFLCGIASPAASRAKLTRDQRFGCLAQRRFATVLAAAAEELGQAGCGPGGFSSPA